MVVEGNGGEVEVEVIVPDCHGFGGGRREGIAYVVVELVGWAVERMGWLSVIHVIYLVVVCDNGGIIIPLLVFSRRF